MRQGRASCAFNIFSTNGVVPRGGVIPQNAPPELIKGRADHARMLAHAAKRRLAAQSPSEDRAYWKACAPFALHRAIGIRLEAGLAKLP